MCPSLPRNLVAGSKNSISYKGYCLLLPNISPCPDHTAGNHLVPVTGVVLEQTVDHRRVLEAVVAVEGDPVVPVLLVLKNFLEINFTIA